MQPISVAASAVSGGTEDEEGYEIPNGANVALMNGEISGGGSGTGPGPEYEPWNTAAEHDVASTNSTNAPRDGPEYEVDASHAEGYRRSIVAVATRPAAPTRTLVFEGDDDSMALLSI